MVADIFAGLNQKGFSPVYKSGVVLKSIWQYFYKRVHHFNKQEDETKRPNDGGGNTPDPLIDDTPSSPDAPAPSVIDKIIDSQTLKKQFSQALQAKFLIMNQDKIVAFKNKLEQDCKDLLDSPINLFDPKPWD